MVDQVGQGGINGSGSDDQIQEDYKNRHAISSVNGKQVAHEMLPSRHAMANITGGDLFQRSMGNYSKQAPSMTDQAVPNFMNMAKWSK